MKSLHKLCLSLAACLALATFPAWGGEPRTPSGGPTLTLEAPACAAAQLSSSSLVPDLVTSPEMSSRLQAASACPWAFYEEIYPDASRRPGTECGSYNSCTRTVTGCQTPYRSAYKEIFPCCR